ncbi:leydig cell tumor 10 kDa protein homolog [Lytechinus pictus]|uniref:leydig cell tumor 10 kDa protein homolog n=1 Tax=Lytechinus pictus TaxID=7653 RepID=UPI0030BA0C5F
MVQGKIKTKVQVPGKGSRNKQKYAHQKKKGPKRGARFIAPKKAKQIEAAKLKKNITKAISSRNEQEIISQAASKEPKKLLVAAPSSGGGDSKKKGKK